MARRLLALLAVLTLCVAGAPATAAPELPCEQTPEPQRWLDSGEPDQGRKKPIIAVHRGAGELAPENTLDSYRYALAYEVEMVEVDVQQTADHRYVAFHDLDVAAKTNGTGSFPLLTFDQARALNVADNDKWRGSAYDPSRMPSLDEVLALVSKTRAGIMFDLKESVADAATVANMAAEYALLDRSVFIPYVPGRAEMIKAAQPAARLNFSNQFGELPDGAPPGLLFGLTPEYWSFGSSLPAFDKEDIAEIHDGCGLVIPNVYQGDVTDSEAGDLAYALSIGADGAQVNNPDVATEVLERPVHTVIAVGDGLACLQNKDNEFGLPGKTIAVDGKVATTGRDGCVALPPAQSGQIVFDGDGSAQPSAAAF
jgi:hypothetical protein